jgi:Domain of unknown function (DUF4214)
MALPTLSLLEQPAPAHRMSPKNSADRFKDGSSATPDIPDFRSADNLRRYGRNDEFAGLTAKYLRLLHTRMLELKELQNALSPESTAGGCARLDRRNPGIVLQRYQVDIGGPFIDLNEATRAGRRGFIFVHAEPEQYTTWYVFASSAIYEERRNFAFRGSVSGSLPNETFVEQAYRAVLGRDADIEERDVYIKSAESGHVSRTNLLFTLLCSQEMQSQLQTLIVLPAPSRWFFPRLTHNH